jgi:hypothetical protein
MPVAVQLGKLLVAGNNRIEVRESKPGATATLHLVNSYFVPWKPAPAADSAGSLRFSVQYDKPQAAIGDEITATVRAERVGFRGYGMMLAEIGLPPGVDVDRESLERALAAGDAGLYQYDVLPDRIVAYLWPRAGGSRFEFKFKVRYGLNAQTTPSVLYDYYNPEERVVVRPVRFNVQQGIR